MSKKVTLRSCDGEVFDVEEDVALQSQTIKNMIEVDCAEDLIPLPNVTGKILAKIIKYCKKHVETSTTNIAHQNNFNIICDADFQNSTTIAHKTDLKTWDADFVKVDQATLIDLIWAANYLEIKSLLELTCQTVADMMKGKTAEQIRNTFNIENDYTPEEEAEVRRENQWAFEFNLT